MATREETLNRAIYKMCQQYISLSNRYQPGYDMDIDTTLAVLELHIKERRKLLRNTH